MQHQTAYADCVLIPGGFGSSGIEGKIKKTKDFLNAIDFLIDQDCKIKTKVNGKNVECD